MDDQILQTAADMYGTPSYVFDLDEFHQRIRHMKEILGHERKICYAMKANPFLAATAAQAADGLEVCSPGEYAICRRAGVPGKKIVLSGVNKEPQQILEVMGEGGAAAFTAESLYQLQILEACAAQESGQRTAQKSAVPVLLRLTSGNQFGMDEETVRAIIRDRGSYPHLDFIGLQYYSGTQKKQMPKLKKELEYLDGVLAGIREELVYELRELEYGPGLSIPYFEGQEIQDEDLMLREFRDFLDQMEFTGTITLEAGRFLAAPCGSYITQVVDLKRSQGQNYCIVDGGIHHVNYYGQAMAMKIPLHRFMPRQASGRREEERWTVCGSLCTSGDMLVKNLPLPDPAMGDLLVFDRIGAYSVTEGIYLFLSRRLPRILTYTESDGLCLVRRDLPTDPLNDGSIHIDQL